MYAPTEEQPVRYDGIYRIVRAYRKRGNQDWLVCRYLFVRCDNAAAPWSSEGACLCHRGSRTTSSRRWSAHSVASVQMRGTAPGTCASLSQLRRRSRPQTRGWCIPWQTAPGGEGALPLLARLSSSPSSLHVPMCSQSNMESQSHDCDCEGTTMLRRRSGAGLGRPLSARKWAATAPQKRRRPAAR